MKSVANQIKSDRQLYKLWKEAHVLFPFYLFSQAAS